MEVVAAGPAHGEVLAGIHEACFPEGPVWSAGSFQSLLAMPGSLGLVAVRETMPMGFVLVQAAADQAELILIAVLPQARRQGVARDLLDLAIARIGNQGCNSLFLEVAEDNLEALAAYRAMGFEASGRRKGYYRRPAVLATGADRHKSPMVRVDAILMRRVLV